MYVWGRLVAHGFLARRRPRLAAPFGTSLIAMRAWPADCDMNGHVNNGRYLMIADLGRYDLMERTGIWHLLREAGLVPMIGGAATVFRREIRLWQRFEVSSRLVTWRGTRAVCEQRFLLPKAEGEPETAVLLLTTSGFYDTRARRFAEIDAVFGKLGIAVTAPEPEDFVAAFLAEQEAARGALAGQTPA